MTASRASPCRWLQPSPRSRKRLNGDPEHRADGPFIVQSGHLDGLPARPLVVVVVLFDEQAAGTDAQVDALYLPIAPVNADDVPLDRLVEDLTREGHL